MDMTNNTARRELLAWSRKVVAAIGERRDDEAVTEIQRAINGLQSNRFCLAVLGKAKRGKSTLLNAVLGRSDDTIAPVDKLPASSAISRFRWAETEKATVVFRDGHTERISFDRVREFVTEENNKENHKGVDVVEIEGPFPGLDRDLELVDTPGAGSIHEYHDTLLHAFIPQADAVIVLVTARMPIDQDELDLLRKVKAADIRKVFFAVNKTDESNAQDIADAVAHNSRLLAQAGIHIGHMHQISAKAAFKGDMHGSGVPAMMADIGKFLAANRGRVIEMRFASRVRAAAEPFAQALQVQVASSSKSLSDIDIELAALRGKKLGIEAEQGFAEREFMASWQRAVEGYERGLKAAKTEVAAAVLAKVQQASVFEVASLAKLMPTHLTQIIEEHLAAVATGFEQSAREACNRLQANYPGLNVGEAGSVMLRTREGNAMITGGVGGVAVAATGVGFAVTGAATAAGIAAANAAALAASTTVAAPSILSGLLSLAGLEILAPLATGTATVAAPAALTAMPMWVALAGPIGWSLAGIGVLAVPFSWRLSKLKLKDKLEEACQDQVNTVFAHLHQDRLPAIRQLGKSIAEDIRLKLDRQLAHIEAALQTAREQRPSDVEAAALTARSQQLQRLLSRYPAVDTSGAI